MGRRQQLACLALLLLFGAVPQLGVAADCPTEVRFEPDGGTLDAGWSGHARDEPIFGTTLHLALSCGAGTAPCGTCAIAGIVPDPSRLRCRNDTAIACTVATEVTDCGATGRCRHYLSPPQSLAVGGFATCHTTEANALVGGNVGVESGAIAVSLSLEAVLYRGIIDTAFDGGPLEGCPRCDGTCDSGPRAGLACEAHGTSPLPDFGSTSFDCPPFPSDEIVHMLLGPIPLSTTPTSVTLSDESPRCSGGPPGAPCFCSTCNDALAEPCFTNADCPPSGGNPGICHGRRCLGGANDGHPCGQPSSCPGGVCGRPGEPTRPNTCIDDTATPAIEGCTPDGNGQGVCTYGPIVAYCSNHPDRGCLDDSFCDDVPGTCTFSGRPCYPDNGVNGGTVAVDATATAPLNGIADPTDLGALVCQQPTSDDFTNIAWGLPGLARLHLGGRLVFTGAGPTPTPTATPTPDLCPPLPAACRTPLAVRKASLQLTDRMPDDKDRLVWTWSKGAATDLSELGDPLATDDYVLCLYDASGQRATMRIPAGGTCQGRPCWRSRSTGFLYRTKDGAPHGITQLTLKAGGDGKAQLLAKGRGTALSMPPLASLTPPLRAQLRNVTTAACWGATFTAPFDRATEVLLKDKSD